MNFRRGLTAEPAHASASATRQLETVMRKIVVLAAVAALSAVTTRAANTRAAMPAHAVKYIPASVVNATVTD